jgi:hypothetical protein
MEQSKWERFKYFALATSKEEPELHRKLDRIIWALFGIGIGMYLVSQLR